MANVMGGAIQPVIIQDRNGNDAFVSLDSTLGGSLSACGTVAATGNTTLIAAPGAGFRIVLSYVMVQNESAAPTTILMGDNNGWYLRFLGQTQGDLLLVQLIPGREWRLSENSPLLINLSGANQIGYSIMYYVERTG